MPTRHEVPARAGLLGNPSDGYGGARLAFAVADFGATVRLEPRVAGPRRAPASDAP